MKERKITVFYFIISIIISITIESFFIVAFPFNLDDTKIEINYDNLKIVDEGNVSNKRIDKGFGISYIIEIHNDSEYNLGKLAYFDIRVNDYIIIYEFFFGFIYQKINIIEVNVNGTD